MPTSFQTKLQVADWKETPVQVRSSEFCEIFKNDYLVEHVWTAASWDIPARSTLKKWRVFSVILIFIHFKSILESCTASGVCLEPYQTSTMKRSYKNSQELLAVVFSQKHSIIDISQCSKYGSAAFFFIFLHFLRFDTWMNIWKYCFSFESVQLLCSRDVNQSCYKMFFWFPNHLLYTDHKILNFHIFIS